MMVPLRLWLILSLAVAAPLNSNVDKEAEDDLVTENIVSVDGMNSDALHNHTSQNDTRDAKHIYGGDINFSGTITSSGDHARISIGSIFSNDLSQESNDDTDPDPQEPHNDNDPDPQEPHDDNGTDNQEPRDDNDSDTQEPRDEPDKACICLSFGDCIEEDFRCDGFMDCDDGSDEERCETIKVCENESKNPTACSCKNPDETEESACSFGQRCNEDGTCQDDCKADEFSCASGDQCVKLEFKCDDSPDCSDDSDEEDCPESETRLKRSTRTVTIGGQILLPANLDFILFPTNSRVYVSFDYISNPQSTNFGIVQINVSNKPSKEVISFSFELTADLPNSKQITMSATINMGWERDPNSDEWIRKGDFYNDVSHSLYIKNDTAEYEKNISVVLYDY